MIIFPWNVKSKFSFCGLWSSPVLRAVFSTPKMPNSGPPPECCPGPHGHCISCLRPLYTIPDHQCIGFSFISDWGFVYTAPYESDTLCSWIRYNSLCKHPHSGEFSVSDSWKQSGMKSDPISCKPGLRHDNHSIPHWFYVKRENLQKIYVNRERLHLFLVIRDSDPLPPSNIGCDSAIRVYIPLFSKTGLLTFNKYCS